MKKILFSIIILVLFAIALFGNNGDDFADVNAQIVSGIASNPLAAEVFSLSNGAVET